MPADPIEAHMRSKLASAGDRYDDASASKALLRESGFRRPGRSIPLEETMASCNADRNGRSWGCQCTRLALRILPMHPQPPAIFLSHLGQIQPSQRCKYSEPVLPRRGRIRISHGRLI
ncbi:uncharacterized protein PAN0_007c3145 [Moesziomyces antarcticus]|uniref:Uncharacterized protein n=1 Tax=Pseudozyma antarctica TaxID=84753 RepID=A0A081CE33_PSEA2|nr:uncharacterized protein PAN0_007c3145 [Moesziomyces antarcticus]GAK64929.1 hypothetical protein PAN0_007c3145 [Moesziomyces antarcticus]